MKHDRTANDANPIKSPANSSHLSFSLWNCSGRISVLPIYIKTPELKARKIVWMIG